MTVHNDLRRGHQGAGSSPLDTEARTRDEYAGFLVTLALAAAVTSLLTRPGLGYAGLRPAFAFVAAAALLGAVAMVVAMGASRPASAAAYGRRYVDIWRAPSHDWHLAVLGLLAALPLWALHTRVVVGDSDSARIIATTVYARRIGLTHLIRTQESWLPHILMGPAVALGGIPAAKLVSVVSLQGLFATASYLTWKHTRSTTAALGSVAALYCCEPIVDRAVLLPMYPAMLLLGLLGLHVAHRSLTRQRGAWLLAFGAAVLLAAAVEAHALGQLFVIPLAFLVLTGPLRRTVPGVARLFVALAVAFIPRMLMNISHGGFSRLLGSRVDYWITEGYLLDIQSTFLRLPVRYSVGEWLARGGDALPKIVRTGGVLMLVVAVLGLLLLRGRARRYAAACMGGIALVIVYKRIQFFPRYFVHLLLGAALVAGAGLGVLARERHGVGRLAAVAAVVVLTVAGGINLSQEALAASQLQDKVLLGPFPRLAAAIDDDRAVVGVRAGQLTFVDPDRLTYGGQFFSEREYVTYLTWPSDRAVINVLERHDIGWVLVTPDRRLEKRYHETWVIPAHGKPVRHSRMISGSPAFCVEEEVDGYLLYRLGTCVSTARTTGDLAQAR